jgi:hypothetical protein
MRNTSLAGDGLTKYGNLEREVMLPDKEILLTNKIKSEVKSSIMLTLSLRPPSRNLLINALNRRRLRVKPTMTKES